jgi:O-antigen ligase
MTTQPQSSAQQMPKTSFTLWVLMIVFAWFLPFAYFATHAVPLPFFFSGLLLLGYWKYFKRYWAIFTPLIILLGLAFLGSDFVKSLEQGASLSQAFGASTKVFLTPQLIFLTMGATLLAVDNLSDHEAGRLMGVVKYSLMGLGLILILEAVSGGHFQTFWRTELLHTDHPWMIMVRLSNANTAMLLLFWPVAYYLNHLNKTNFAILLAVAIMWLGIVVGTNIQAMGLLASVLVFLAARHWPDVLTKQGLGFERLLAIGAAGITFLFPFFILGLKSTSSWTHLVTAMPESWSARLKIWAFSADRCMEKPWLGWGYESARQFGDNIPAHPHNMALQAWLELGIFGLVLLSAFWGLIFWHFKTEPKASNEVSLGLDAPLKQPDFKPYILATTALYFMINTLSYGLWRSWLYGLGAITAMVCIIIFKAVRDSFNASETP